MIDIDKWQEIYLTVSRHKLRTALTAFGVFWGIFMLVVLLGAGNGLKNGVKRMFERQENVVYFWASKTTLPYAGLSAGRDIRITDADINALINNLDTLDKIAPNNYMGSQNIAHDDKNDTLLVIGAYPTVLDLQPYDITSGRFINDLDIAERRKIAVIGTRVRNVLFGPDENPVGKHIKINSVFFQVVGLFDSRRPAEDAERDEETVLIPNTTLRHTFNQTDRIHQMMMTPKPGISAETLEKQAKVFLQERHKVHPEDRIAIGTFNMQTRFEEVQGLHTGVRLFSWLVAIGTILAGAIGVGNIMLIVVKERTREIGIRKALGAQPASIIAMIVQESLVITVVSGYAGLVAGVALLETVNRVLSNIGADSRFFSNPEISFQTALLAICVLTAAGMLAALMPAARAARIDPILALQEE